MGARGWVAGTSIEYRYQNRPVAVQEYGGSIGIPIISFVIGTYWGNYYSNRPFYRQRNYWYCRPTIGRPPPRPIHRPPPRPQPGGGNRPPRPGIGNPGNGHRPSPGSRQSPWPRPAPQATGQAGPCRQEKQRQPGQLMDLRHRDRSRPGEIEAAAPDQRRPAHGHQPRPLWA